MFNEIEELEKKLKRGPASAQLDEAFPLPTSASKWDTPSNDHYDPTKDRAAGSVVGAIAPDYSGYDELEKRINGLRPRDTSTQDLINMGVSTGIGALFGRVGVGAKEAGAYGLKRADKAEKDQDDIEKMILKIQADKAAKMAAGKKGTKIGGSISNADDPTKNRYLGPDGYLHTPTRKRSDGTWAQLETDPVYDKPNPEVKTLDTPDGGSVDALFDRNKMTSIGSKNAPLKAGKTANNETFLYNDRTSPQGLLGDVYNKTSNGLTKLGNDNYQAVHDKKMADGQLNATEDAYNDMKMGMAGIHQGDVAGAKIAVKNFASALEKGHRTTDFDVQFAQDLNKGLVSKLNAWLEGKKTGRVPEDIRAELESGFAVIEAGLADGHSRRLTQYNDKMKNMLGKEHRSDLEFKPLDRFGRREQDKLFQRAEDSKTQWMSTGEWEQDWVVGDKPMLNPVTGKPIKAKYIMRNGKPYVKEVLE